ncbi:MAG: mkl [Gammaproteobacteria bacterium]|jgi:phospholipid/cholesterol/gamma-HCH transport system ATP-binding protein|nr:mkl [Gammaproteobacteria bacterium]
MEQTVAIDIKGLKSQFGGKVIHDNLDLTIYQGEIIALVGGSGCGKTTLLQQLLGLHKPTRGEINILGMDILKPGADLRSLQHRWGVLFQQGALFSSLTVLENVTFVLRELTSLPKDIIEEIAYMKINMAQFPVDSVHKYPSELSGGMLKRAALARAIVMDPEVLFLDEPTSGLDPVSAASLDSLVLNLQKSLGLTIVLVTHDPDTLWTAVDRVAFLGDKRVLAVKPMAELIKDPNPAIQEYFSSERTQRKEDHGN